MKKNIGVDKITNFIDRITVTYSKEHEKGILVADGYTYCPDDNSVITFEHTAPVSLIKSFIEGLNNYVVMGNGAFIINDEIKPLKMETRIRNIYDCNPVYNELMNFKKLTYENNTTIYNRVVDIFENFV